MEEKDKNAYKQLLQGIQSYVNKCIAESNRDITTTARIVEIKNELYTVEINGVQYSGIDTVGGTCSVNEMVRVVIPQGQYNNMFILKGGSGGTVTPTPSVSGVSSVNDKTGDVTLNYADVGALSSTTKIPTKTSDLDNDSNYVSDSNYNHTDNNYTTDDKNSVETISNKVDKIAGKGLSTNDLTNYLKADYDDAVLKSHEHSNKSILDATTASYTTEDKKKLDNTVSNTDYNTLKGRVDTNEDNIAMLDSDVEGLTTDVGTLKTDMTTVKGAVTTIQGNYVPKTRKVNGKALSADITLGASDVKAIPISQKGTANGVAELDANGIIKTSQLPSSIDEIIEADSKSDFPTTGESSKIYIALDTNLTYRWTGTQYVEISPSLALGETSSTAYRGDRGKIAYDHSQKTSGNPHKVTKNDVGLGNVGNYKSVSVSANQGLTDTEKSNARANIGAGTSSFSGSYNDLTNKPTIPSVGNGTITIKQNGTTKGTFTTNQSGNTTIELTDDNTTYGVATTTANGLMSKDDKVIVDRLNRESLSLVPRGTAITANQNLNTVNFIKVGKYYCGANTIVQTLTNCPTTDAFMMEVFSPLSTAYDNETTSKWVYRLRRITTFMGHIYIQKVSSGSTEGTFTYGTWYKMYSELDKPVDTWIAFKGATATSNGTAGYVPAPTMGNQDKFFRADGTWATLSLTWNE